MAQLDLRAAFKHLSTQSPPPPTRSRSVQAVHTENSFHQTYVGFVQECTAQNEEKREDNSRRHLWRESWQLDKEPLLAGLFLSEHLDQASWGCQTYLAVISAEEVPVAAAGDWMSQRREHRAFIRLLCRLQTNKGSSSRREMKTLISASMLGLSGSMSRTLFEFWISSDGNQLVFTRTWN